MRRKIRTRPCIRLRFAPAAAVFFLGLILLTHSGFGATITVRKLNHAHTEVLVDVDDVRGFQSGDISPINQECSLRILKVSATGAPTTVSGQTNKQTPAGTKASSGKFVAATNLCENLSLLRVGAAFSIHAPHTPAAVKGANTSNSPVPSQAPAPVTLPAEQVVEPKAESPQNAGQFVENGFQVGIVKEFFTIHVTNSDQNQVDSVTGEVAQTVGIQVGYAYVPVEHLGFNLHTGIDFYEYTTKSVPLGALLTYGFNPYFALELGPKSEYFFGNASVSDAIGFGYGGEVGCLILATPNFGGELKFAYTHHDHVTLTNRAVADFTGLSLGLTATF